MATIRIKGGISVNRAEYQARDIWTDVRSWRASGQEKSCCTRSRVKAGGEKTGVRSGTLFCDPTM